MADHDIKRPFRSRDGAPFIVFLIMSLVINGVGAYCGWWIKFPEPPPLGDDAIQLTDIDVNDVEKLGDPNAPEEQPPPEPEPTPPAEREPTPPPLDKPPEFEIPQATPTPAPSAAPTPENSPKPHPTPKPHVAPAVKPTGTPNPHPATAPGLPKGSLTGAPDGTGNGGPRSGLLLRSPRPPYPSQALQMHLSGDVRVMMTVQAGNIIDAHGSGPPMLASAAARWVRTNWKFTPTTNGTYTLPVSFVLAH
jgi:outer membrane biosynthesis protein TonB